MDDVSFVLFLLVVAVALLLANTRRVAEAWPANPCRVPVGVAPRPGDCPMDDSWTAVASQLLDMRVKVFQSQVGNNLLEWPRTRATGSG